VQTPWAEGVNERHRFDVQRLIRQAPAIAEAIYVDGKASSACASRAPAGMSR
jgi:hypothetical protein